jgi:hypothetical protein
MHATYGEIADTVGSDGDPIDVFVGPDFDAEIAYVVHQRIAEGEGEGGYDEDKVMLGWPTQEDALASYRQHYDKPDDFEGGITVITVDELRERLATGDLSVAPVPITLEKAEGGGDKPAGAGWTAIPGGKHGGYRKPRGGGARGYEYWYPGQVPHTAHPKWERDPVKRPGISDIAPGAIVEVGGRTGLYHWTPEHAKAGEGATWVTSVNTGEHELVRANTLYPSRPYKAPERVKRPPPPPTPPSGPKAPQKPQQGPSTGPTGFTPPPIGPGLHPEALRTTVYEDSRAAKGTVMHGLEHGEFLLFKSRGRHDDHWRWGVAIPREKQDAFVTEFRPLVHKAALKIAKRYGIPIKDRKGPTVAYEELTAGARVGLVMSLASYTGGAPFIPHAMDYAIGYARQTARNEMGAGVTLPDRTMRMLGGFMAARSRARARFGVEEPSSEQMARVWSLTKRDAHGGAHVDLGRYADDKGDIVDQASEQVPSGPWRVRGPDGREHGEELPGKAKLAEAMARFARGDKVEDDEWLVKQPTDVLPGAYGTMVPTGTAHHLREQAEGLLDKLNPSHNLVLRLKWGFDDPEGEGATNEAIADKMRIAVGKPVSTRRREVNALATKALAQFKKLAAASQAEVQRHVDRWATTKDEPPSAEELGRMPSHRQLAEELGNDERVGVYLTAVRAGNGVSTLRALHREKAGKATEDEIRTSRTAYHAQRDKERIAAFNRYRAVEVDPERARDVGVQAGTSPESVGLYPDDVISGYMTAISKRGSKHGE